MLKKLILSAVSLFILCGCDTIRKEMARDPESGLIWFEPRVGITQGSTYLPPAGDVMITLPESSSSDASLSTSAVEGGFWLRFFDVRNGTWQLESRTMPNLKFERCFTDDNYMRKVVDGTEILYKSRYHAKLCKYVVDTKDKALYFLFFLPEGSSATADGKRVDVYLSTAIFELNGKIYRLSFQPALSDHHDPIEILELDALRKCRSGIKLQETK
ncbi:MAG: hypothetical protein J6C30_01120 [Lentisphaeria bacterium]|nr:hypothetical protein [Lentisphaeria bacterium]